MVLINLPKFSHDTRIVFHIFICPDNMKDAVKPLILLFNCKRYIHLKIRLRRSRFLNLLHDTIQDIFINAS